MYWILHITVEHQESKKSLNTRLSTQQSDLLEDAFSRGPAVLVLEDLYI